MHDKATYAGFSAIIALYTVLTENSNDLFARFTCTMDAGLPFDVTPYRATADGLLQGIERLPATPPSADARQQLFAVVACYRACIDTFPAPDACGAIHTNDMARFRAAAVALGESLTMLERAVQRLAHHIGMPHHNR